MPVGGAGRHSAAVRVLLVCLLAAVTVGGLPAGAATFTVTTSDDTVDGACDAHCSLREAIAVANARRNEDRIELPAGLFLLSRAGAGEDDGRRGDLDVGADVVISGAGAAATIIDAQRLDRVVHVINGVVRLVDLTLRGGRLRGGAGNGAGVAVQGGGLTLERVVLAENDSDGWGGGAYVGAGDLTVVDSTLRDNRASRGGGLYYQGFTRALLLRNATVSGNAAADGGGVFIDQECGFAAPCAIESSTIAYNQGGGVRNDAGALSLLFVATLLAGNAPGNCAPGSGRSLGSNLDDDGTCPWSRASDLSRAVAALLPLRATGGATPTHALAVSSAAIDAGNEARCPGTDQRGAPRHGRCDIGAHEATAGACGDGVVDLGEACDVAASADECCTATCVLAPAGTRCESDADPCTDDVCDVERAACAHAPLDGSGCAAARRAELQITGAGSLTWHWRRGAASTLARFGVPAGTAALCVFDAAAPRPLAGLVVAAGDHWRSDGGAGFRYRDASAAAASVSRAVLRAGRTRLQAQAAGVRLPAGGVDSPLRVQWRAATGACWESVFAADELRENGSAGVTARHRGAAERVGR